MAVERMVSEPDGLRKILDHTEQALLTQGWVPASPGCLIDGRPFLCAGAMLVREALAMKWSPAAAEWFAANVVDEDRDFICTVGTDVGLDGNMVRARIIENDALTADERLDGMIDQLRRLATTR